MATAPDIPVVSRDISCPAVRDPYWSLINAVGSPRFLEISHFRHKNWPRKNLKKSGAGLERSKGLRVISAAGYPPCPIDRRCGARLWWWQPRPQFFCGNRAKLLLPPHQPPHLSLVRPPEPSIKSAT